MLESHNMSSLLIYQLSHTITYYTWNLPIPLYILTGLLYSSVVQVPLRLFPPLILIKVKVTLRLTVSQSVSQPWCRAKSGLITRFLLLFDSFGLLFCGAPSLTRGRVCLLSESLSAVVSHLHNLKEIYILQVKNSIFTTYIESQSIKAFFDVQEHRSRRYFIDEIKVQVVRCPHTLQCCGVTCTETKLACVKSVSFFNVL
jgi:hypothetical protein